MSIVETAAPAPAVAEPGVPVSAPPTGAITPAHAAATTRSLQRWATLALFSCPVIWGTTFAVTRVLVGEGTTPPFYLLTIRFGLGFLAIWALTQLARRWQAGGTGAAPVWRWRDYGEPTLVLGGLTYLGFSSQTLGMKTIAAGNSALITGLFVIFTPMMLALLIRRTPAARIWAAAAISFAGTWILSLTGQAGGWTPQWGLGESLTLLCAALFAIQIIATEYYTTRFDALYLTLGALLFAGVGSGITSLAWEFDRWAMSEREFLGAAYLGVTGTGICFALGTWGQRHVGVARATMIFGCEPLFGAISAAILLESESFHWRMVSGGLLILWAIWLCRPIEGERSPLDEFLAKQQAAEGKMAIGG
jgi:drug/metabolite transporter (DMT)-like permease